MSALLELLNEVRRSARVEWLTPAQREAYDALMARARAYSPAVLVGPPGSGKTLIGWLVRQRLGFGHVAHPLRLPVAEGTARGIVIDNADLAQIGARALLGRAELRGWATAVMLARTINPEGLPVVRLPAPSAVEIAGCLANLPMPLTTDVAADEHDLWRAVRRRLAELTPEEHNEC